MTEQHIGTFGQISTSHYTCGKETKSFKITEIENVFSMIITNIERNIDPG